jgi:hypothetical protein
MPRPPRTSRLPLQEVYYNSRSRVVALHDYGMKNADIARGETRLLQHAANLQTRAKSRIM